MDLSMAAFEETYFLTAAIFRANLGDFPLETEATQGDDKYQSPAKRDRSVSLLAADIRFNSTYQRFCWMQQYGVMGETRYRVYGRDCSLSKTLVVLVL
jgi:hypothetical protein